MRSRGFSIVELLVVMTVGAILLGFAVNAYGNHLARTASRSAAQQFARDLTVARTLAVQYREPMVMRFQPSDLRYVVRSASGTEVLRRNFGEGGEFRLNLLDLEMPGDSAVVSSRGVLDLSEVEGTLGRAVFHAGGIVHQVSFNALGASRIQEP